jgi:acetolactate synthase-1/2/3 large subunit
MKVSVYIAQFIKGQGIDTVFELQGGMITRIIDEIHRQGGIKIVSMHHEQAAAFAADAYARVSNKPGIAMATSGPGATNLITGIGSCYFDSVPAIFITGQVNLDEQKGVNPTRQIGFQETDIVSIVKPITKAVFAITSPEEIPGVFHKAYQLSMDGRPGPVLIDIPMNIQNQEIPFDHDQDIDMVKDEPGTKKIIQFLGEFKEALQHASRPLCLAGRGVSVAGVREPFLSFIEAIEMPVVTSLLAIDAIPFHHPNRIGFIGTYGNRWANYSLGSCDLLLVLGSRLDLRQTGADVESFIQGKNIFHVDIDKAELNNRIKGCRILQADLKDFFAQGMLIEMSSERKDEWFNEIKAKYKTMPDVEELRNIKGINPNFFLHSLSKASSLAKAITTDVGNNQMWSAQSLELLQNQLFLSSGGMGAMGYSLPAAIGAAFALSSSPILCISGDGGFQINIQELQTIARNKLPIKIVILNNHCLGMIRQFQDVYFDSVYQSTVWGYDTPDFEKIATAYGIGAYTITSLEEIDNGIARLWENSAIPFLLNVNIDVHTNVFPKMMFGSPITKMEPELFT